MFSLLSSLVTCSIQQRYATFPRRRESFSASLLAMTITLFMVENRASCSGVKLTVSRWGVYCLKECLTTCLFYVYFHFLKYFLAFSAWKCFGLRSDHSYMRSISSIQMCSVLCIWTLSVLCIWIFLEFCI